MTDNTDKLPCLECDRDCEAKTWLWRAKVLSEAGFRISKVNLPCPKNSVTYEVGPIEPKKHGEEAKR